MEVDDRTIYRTDVDAPLFGEEFASIIQNIFVRGLRDLVDLPPLKDIFLFVSRWHDYGAMA